MSRLLLMVVVFGFVPPALAVDVQHESVGCVVADQHPRLEAYLAPADAVARARVHFKPENGKHWYSVPLKVDGDVFAAVLPKPRKNLRSLTYYIEVTDSAMAATRTAEFSPIVASGPTACQDRKVASSLASATVALEVPAGAPSIPAGFSGSGIAAGAAAGAAAATVAAGAGAAAAGGGGTSAALLIGGGVVAAGAATAVVVTQAGGGDGGDDVSTTHTEYNAEFFPSPPGLDVTACGSGGQITFSSQSFVADPSGNFEQTWSPLTPVVRARGTVNASAVSITLTCLNGAGAPGSINASGGGGSYNGTFSFNGSNGTVRITQRQRAN